MRSTFRLSPPGDLTPGAIATIRLPGPRMYHKAIIAGLAIADVEWVRLVLNNRVSQEWTAEALNVANMFDGLGDWDASTFIVPFDQVGLKQRGHEEMTALNVGDMEIRDGYATGVLLSGAELQIKVAAGAVSPAITDQRAVVSPAKQGMGPGFIRTVYRIPGVPGQAGRWDFDKLPHGTRASQFLSRLFIKAANVTELEIERDTRTAFERTAAVNDFLLANSERNPQAGWYVVDFTEDGYGENRLDVRNIGDFRLKFTSSGAEVLDMYAEYIGELET